MSTASEVKPGFVLNAANLSNLFGNLGPGDSIEMFNVGGRVRFALHRRDGSGKKRKKTPLGNGIFLSPPVEKRVRVAWMPAITAEPSDDDRIRRHAHKSDMRKRAKKGNDGRRLLLDLLKMEMIGRSIEEATLIKEPNHTYWRYEVGEFIVFCSSTGKIMKWKHGENGEEVYAPSE